MGFSIPNHDAKDQKEQTENRQKKKKKKKKERKNQGQIASDMVRAQEKQSI